MANNKVLFGSIRTIILVVAVIGIVSTVSQSNQSAGKGFRSSQNTLQTKSKSVEDFCSSTSYKDSCHRTLRYKMKSSADIKEAFNVSVHAILEEIKEIVRLNADVFKGATNSLDKQAYENCEGLFEDAVDHLEAVLTKADEKMLNGSNSIKTWLSSVISMQWMCTEEISNPELKAKMDKGIVNATQLTSNALALVDQVFSFLQGIDLSQIKLPPISGHGRKLFREHTVDAEGFPMWFPEKDRRILAGGPPAPNAVVAQDGSGKFKTITDALKAIPKRANVAERYVIYVKAGVYKEIVLMDKSMVNVFMYGDGARKTIVTGNRGNTDGYSTSSTATFAVHGAVGFIAMNMGFVNTAGPEKHQAVALRVRADRCAFFQCRMDGYQDTLYVQYDKNFFRNCVISGTVDFIFGAASAIIQNSLILVRKGLDRQQLIITADGRTEATQFSSIVLQNCQIRPDAGFFPDRLKAEVYLGRPWKSYATTAIMESDIGDLISPAGWLEWFGAESSRGSTIQYAEYGNRGPGSGTSGRVKWPGYHVIDKKAAEQFTAASLFKGNDQWIKGAGIAYNPTFYN